MGGQSLILSGVHPRVKPGRTPRGFCSSCWWGPCLEASSPQRSKLGYRDWHKHYFAEKVARVQPPEPLWKHVRGHVSLLSADSSGNFTPLSQLPKLQQRLKVRPVCLLCLGQATGPVSATCLPSKGLEPCSWECRLQE